MANPESQGPKPKPNTKGQVPKCLGLALLALLHASGAMAQQGPGGVNSTIGAGTPASEALSQLDGVSFEQRLGSRLPLDARLVDEHGRDVALGDYFTDRPVMLAFVYYTCPMLCTQIMNGVSGSVKALPFEPGHDFDVVYISFDPRDTPETALARKTAVLEDYHQTGTAAGWHFLTGDEATVARVAEAAGFSYRWDAGSSQFAHVSGVLVATPDGTLSRYFYGIEYSPKELRMALVESAEGRVGSLVDQLLLYCYHYDPAKGRYGLLTLNLVRLGGALTIVLLGSFILVSRRREHRTNR